MARGVKRKVANRGRAEKEKPEPEQQQNEPGQSFSQPPVENKSPKRAASAEPEPQMEPKLEREQASKQEPEPKPEQEPEPSHKEAAGGRRKRAKVSKAETKTEYFLEKRNLEDLWQQTFPVGTEWDQLDMVYQYKWNFSNLEDAFEEGGLLFDKMVYLFGCTEAQMVSFEGRDKVILIPVVVAVVSPFPPSDKIGIKSVQRETEEIIPMKQMKMDWVPYIPLEKRESQVERLKKSQIFILSCVQRRAGLRHMKVERVKKFEYCLPYFHQPLHEDEFEQSTVVDLLFPIDPKPVFCEFDWKLDELEDFTDTLIEEEELPADQKEPFKEYLKEKVREAIKANREAKEARIKALAEMSPETKTALENMRFYKFYPVPSPNTPDVSKFKSPFINRYYGKAHCVI